MADSSRPAPASRRLLFPRERERLWKIWWLWGVPVAWTTSILVIGAEEARLAGWHAAGDAIDIARLALYWAWCRTAWRRSSNVGHPLWTLLSKAALSAGMVATVLA